VRLYHFPTSPNCLKVRAVAYEIGVELELVTVNIFKSESRSATFRTLNPNGLVPVLVDGDFVLWESNAILTYLASKYGSPTLISTDARRRADIDRWLHWESAHMGPAIAKVAFERCVKPIFGGTQANEVAVSAALSAFEEHCRALETSLGDKEFVTSSLSVADFALASSLCSGARVGLSVGTFPRTTAWLRRMLARDSVRRALAEAQLSLSEIYSSGTNAGVAAKRTFS
jgi:glutathione S-transferase